jgi:hypothetical protein
VASGPSHIGQIVVVIEQVPTQNSSALPQHRRLAADYSAQVKRAQTVNQTLWRACPLARDAMFASRGYVWGLVQVGLRKQCLNLFTLTVRAMARESTTHV